MATLNANGFTIRTMTQIVEALRQRAATEEFFGENIDTTPDSALGILINLFAAGVLEQEELSQAVYDQFNRDKAEGKNLDDLAALIGISRLRASGSTGELLFTGSNGITVPQGFATSDVDDRIVLTDNAVTLNRNSCQQSRFSVSSVTVGQDYTLNIEGTEFTYTSKAGDTNIQIIEGLHNAVGIRPTFMSQVEEETTLAIISTLQNNSLTTLNTSNLQLDSVSSTVRGTAAVAGATPFVTGSITQIPNAQLGVNSVTNPSDFTLGRLGETDQQLRLRLAQREQSTGTATIPAIEASLSSLTGVTNVLVIENDDITADSAGRPPKSYQTYVSGGNEQDIANEIWTTKPAGIQTFGDITRVVRDSQGVEQSVSFSRPTERFAHVRVTYSLYDEESFPVNGEEAIRNAVLNFGNSLSQGNDVIPQRFNAAIFQNVSGLLTVSTEIGLTTTSGGTPSYVTTPIPVANTEFTSFDLSRITASI